MDKRTDLKILLIGCGKMGGALLKGWLKQNIAGPDICVIEPHQENLNTFLSHGVSFYSSLNDLDLQYKPDFIVFAIKPQMMDKIVPVYKNFSKECVIISIAAGKSINYFERHLGKEKAIIRAMPNTPAAVGRGITIACGNASVRKHHQKICLSLLAAVGDARWLVEEDLIDAVTAISGSGPAYVFLLAETMLTAGIDAGLDQELATELAIKTVAGSGELLIQSSEKIATLRKNVTSPGGTTEAALSILMGNNGLEKLMGKAIKKAILRSKTLDS